MTMRLFWVVWVGPMQSQGEASRIWEKQENELSTQNIQKEHNPAHTLILGQQDPLWTSDIQNYKMENLCSFKPPSLL